jgi:hypothetical protein
MPPKPIATDDARIVGLYREGWTLGMISAAVGVSKPTVWRRLRANRITLRKPGTKGVADAVR